MASTFPTALDTIPASPTTEKLGESAPKHSEMHNLLRDAIAALEATVGTDAAAKLARLLGVLGGQTLIGGTAATDALTLQGTSGDGTGTAKAVRVAVGNNGGTEAVTVRNDGNVGIGNTNPSADFTVGTDVLRVDGSLMAIGAGAELGSAATTVPVISNVSATSRAASTLTDYTAAEATVAIRATISPTQNKTGNPYKYGLCTEINVPVENTYTLSNIYGSVSSIYLAGSGSAGSVVPVYARSYLYGSTCSFLGGVYSSVYHAGSGTISTANSVAAELNVTGGGTITQGWGTEGVISVSGNSTVSTAIPVGVYLSVAAGSTVNNAYGVNIGGPADGWSNAGTLTNCYALYIGSSTNVGTNKWSIYNQSPAVSYLAGSLALGVTSASAKVHAISTTEQLRLGYDASNYFSTTVSSLGKATWSATSGTYAVVGPTNAQATATLGSELVTNSLFTTDLSSWTAGANWAWVSGGAKHTAGSTATLSQNVTVTSGSTYQVSVVISGRTAGSVAFALGAVNVIWGATSTTASASGDRTVIAGASGSVAFTITPTTDFDGSIDSLSIKSVSLGTFPVVFSFTEEGNNAVDIRVSRARYNLSFGRDSGRSITSGNYNTNFGSGTGRSITTGIYNLNFGSDAGYSITTGNSNCNFGVNAGYYLTSGSYNNVFGAFTGENIGTGSNNNLIGNAAGRGYANCDNNVCIGSDAGRLASDGTTTVTTASNCTYVGTATKASGVTVSSEIAIGYQAIGLGSNTTVIGTTSTTKTKMFGTPIFTPATSATPTVNGELLIEATSNTSVTIKLKGTDGVVRSAVLTLA